MRSPSSRNSIARWTFVSKSPGPIFGERRTSLNVTERCRRLVLLLALGQLVLVLTEVEELDDRRRGQRGHLDEVQAPLLRHREGLGRGHHTQLGTLFIDDPDLWDPDHLIDAQVSCYG